MPRTSIDEALADVQQGRFLIVVDDEDRENEGDLVIAAERVTPEAITFMARNACGLICVALTGERLDALQIPMMVPTERNTSPYTTAFTVSVEAKVGISTGISAQDRAATIRTLIDPATRSVDIATPGHVFPLRARDGGVLERPGHTEAGVDLARLAGLDPSAVVCEIMSEDGTMARRPELEHFSLQHGLKMVSVADLVAYRRQRGRGLRRESGSTKLPERFFTISLSIQLDS